MQKVINTLFSVFIRAVMPASLFLVSLKMAAQVNIRLEQPLLGLQNETNEGIEMFYSKNHNFKFHSSLKPYSVAETISHIDSSRQLDFPKRISGNCYSNLNILPIIDYYSGFDFLNSNLIYETTTGLNLSGNFGDSFQYSVSGLGGLSQFPNFTDTLVKEYGIIPGNGMAYRVNDTLSSAPYYSYSNFFGSFSWSPQPFFHMELGKDKLFIGDGYRSLLLSDISNNYPYFKATFTFWRIKYSFWCSWMRDVSQANGFKNDFLNKYGAFHYLSYNINKWLNISLFENIIWQGTDTNRVRSFDVNYLSPLVFFRPVEYSLGSSDNAMMGLNISIKPSRNVKLYSQLILDEFLLKEVRARKGWWANKQGVQAGILYFDAFGIPGFNIRTEFNLVRPYTYTHGSPQQSYTHFNQPLAHPLGANFKEYLGNISYSRKKFRFDCKAVYAQIGKDTNGVASSNVGQNIFLSYLTRPYDYGHSTGQGIKTTFFQADIKASYLLLPKINMRFELGFIQRSLSNERGFKKETPFIYIGLRTGFYNRYRDY